MHSTLARGRHISNVRRRKEHVIKAGTKLLTEAFQKESAITFRGEHLYEDQFICRAEWSEAGAAFYAHGKKFQCLSDRKADFIAEQIMLAQLKEWSEKERARR